MGLRVTWKADFATRNGMGVVAREMCNALHLAGVEVHAVHEGERLEPLELFGSNVKVQRLKQWLAADAQQPSIVVRHGAPTYRPLRMARPEIFDDLGAANVLLWPSDPRLMAPEYVQRANRSFDQLWCDSFFTADMMARAGGDPTKIRVVPGGIDPDLFLPPHHTVAKPAFTFLHVAGPQWLLKGFDILISAFAEEFQPDEAAELLLVIKPHDDFVRMVQDYVAAEGDRLSRSPRVRVHASVYEHHRIKEVYAAADCYVQPSRSESFGLPALEAACCGMPIIVTGEGGMVDFAQHETAFQIEFDERPMAEGLWKGNHAATWFEPRKSDLRRLMRHVYLHREVLRDRARVRAASLRERWSWRNCGWQARKTLEELWPKALTAERKSARCAAGHSGDVAQSMAPFSATAPTWDDRPVYRQRHRPRVVDRDVTMEVELKYQVEGPPGQRRALWENLQTTLTVGEFQCGAPSKICVQDLYYDTPTRLLKVAGFTLRLRDENGARFATMKRKVRKDGARSEREEWEEPLSGEVLSRFTWFLRESGIPLGEATEEDVQRFATGEATLGLVPFLRIRTDRIQRTVRTVTGLPVALLTLDLVTYPGLTDEAFYDIELEQSAQGEGWLELVGQALEEAHGHLVRPSDHSKVYRGLALTSRTAAPAANGGITHGNGL